MNNAGKASVYREDTKRTTSRPRCAKPARIDPVSPAIEAYDHKKWLRILKSDSGKRAIRGG